MLEAEVLTRIDETVAVELAGWNTRLQMALNELKSKLVKTGNVHSSGALHEYARIGCDELDIRASMIWEIIKRCHTTFGSRDNPELLVDLQKRVHRFVTLQAIAIADSTDPRPAPSPPRPGNYVRDTVLKKGQELQERYKNEVHFYLRAINLPAPTSTVGITINGGVIGAIQTGTNAVANMHFESWAALQLVDALNTLTAAIRDAHDIDADARGYSLEIIESLQAAAKAAKPNGPMLRGLLTGLSTVVRTVASLNPAWNRLRDVATTIGIPLP